MPNIGPKRQIALTDSYTKAQANALFPDKTSPTPQDFTAMPTVGGDPIVESDSNADGEWTRWADGTQETVREVGSSSVSAGANDTVNFVFPAAFIAPPLVFALGTANLSNALPEIMVGADYGAAHTTSASRYTVFNRGSSVKTVRVNLLSKGRWK